MFVNNGLPLPRTTGLTRRCISSIKSWFNKNDTILPLPYITMSLPGCFFMREISSAMFSLISLVLFHSGLSSVLEKTLLGRLFILSIITALSVGGEADGQ